MKKDESLASSRAYTIEAFCAAFGIGRTIAFREIKYGRLKAVRLADAPSFLPMKPSAGHRLYPGGRAMQHEIPIGGSTGLSHEHSVAIEVAARYLSETPPIARPAPLVPAMREMFGLTSAEVCAAICESHQIKAPGGANATS